MNPYVFIVGCPRSGTTLLRRIADAHSQLAVMPEQHWLPRLWEWRAGIRDDGTVDSELLDMLLSDRRFELLDLPFKPVAERVEAGPPIRYADFVSGLFDLYGQRAGKPHVGEKTPKYVTQLATLAELWPRARVIHVIRDGRDVALSLIDWDKAERNVGRFPGWASEPVMTAALYWEWSVRRGREDGSRLGENYHELRY
jgi:Sulfotransferase family